MTASVATKTKSDASSAHSQKWVWAKRALTAFFFILIPVLLFTVLKNIEWQDVKQAIHAYQLKTLLLGCLIATTSFLVFSSYDLIALHYLKNPIKVREVLPLAFVGCVFSLNLAWVGGVATRFRLYSRLGLDPVIITKIISTNIITNWLGYSIVGAVIFSSGMLDLPDNWKIGSSALQLMGVALFIVVVSYLSACRFSKRRTFTFFKQEISLPEFKLALVQAGFASLNWCLMGLLIYTLLLGKVPYPMVLGILLMCSVAGAITHIPAGLGVLEAIFIAMLSQQLSKGTIVAALLGYRAIYFLLPLLLAALIYLLLEMKTKRNRK
ncbi:MAG: lysylphosphatidylglycerol synthase domain-containing protein [Cellvibrio sp.]